MIIGKGRVDTDNKNVRLKRVGAKRERKGGRPLPVRILAGREEGALDKGLNARSFQTLYLYMVCFHLGSWPKIFEKKSDIE